MEAREIHIGDFVQVNVEVRIIRGLFVMVVQPNDILRVKCVHGQMIGVEFADTDSLVCDTAVMIGEFYVVSTDVDPAPALFSSLSPQRD